MIRYIEYTKLRSLVDEKYHKMGYDRARDLIKFFSEAELLTLQDRAKLMEYLNLVYKLDTDRKREKRKFNKLRRKNKND